MHKITRVRIYATLAIALMLQMTLFNNLKILGARPDLTLIAVIFFGLFLGGGAGLEAGLIAGFVKDVFAMDFFWINTFVLALSGLLAGTLGAKFSRDSKSGQLVLTFSFTAFSMTLHYVLASFFLKSLTLGFGEYLASSIMPTGVYTSLLSVPIFSKFIDMYGLKELDDLL